ncbi:MAG: pentapeptide repeat-containing protein [Nitrosopumilus sp.]
MKNKTSVHLGIKSGMVLLWSLIIFLSIIVPTTVFAEENTGSIMVDLKSQSGERLDTYQTVLKIFQDGNNTAYRIIEFPEENPILIDSLPIEDNYKIDVYVNGMLSATTKSAVEKEVTLLVPIQGGMRFEILYNDGETPITGAKILLKSNDGQIWQQETVGADGKSKRFWMQSNNLIEDYYVAEIIVEKNLTYTSREQIKFYPDFQGEIKIKTPWPKIIDDLITVSVYNDTSHKVTKDDGKFVVELYDYKNNKISQSEVNHRGDSFFSNIKVGQYTFKTIHYPKDNPAKGEIFGITNRVLSGNESQIEIFNKKSENQGLEKTCNCVAFRLDDVQDYYLNVPQIEIMSMFQKKETPLTIGIIGGFWGNDPKMLNFIKNDMSRPTQTFEIGSHSWNNSPLINYDKEGQRELLQKTNDIINKTLGVTPTSFIAVENKFNNDTKIVLRELNFTHFTAHIQESHTPPYPLENSELYYFPASTQTAILNTDSNIWEPVENEVMYTQATNFLKEYGFAVIMMHPYEFAATDLGVYTGEANLDTIENLGKLIDQFKINGIKIVSLGGITESGIEKDEPIEKIDSESKHAEEVFQSCNCVAFKFVTLQDYWLNDVQMGVIDTFVQNNAGVTVGIIGELFGNDAKLTNYLTNKIQGNNGIEIANNGWSYNSFTDFSETEQNNQIKQSNEHLANIFGETPTVFIPPNNRFNENTILALNSNNMKYISSNIVNDPPPYDFKSNIQHFPAGAVTGKYSTEFNLIQGVNHEKTLSEIQENLNRDGFSVVTLSPQEFAKTEDGKYVNQINEKQVDELESLLEKIQNENLEIVPIGKIDQIIRNKVISDSMKNKTSHCSDPLAPSVDLSGCDLRNQHIEEIDLGNANLKNVDLKGTKIKNVELKNATISDGDLRRTEISGVNLSESELSGINLSNAILRETNLRGSNLEESVLRYMNFKDSDVKGADLSGADLTGSTFRGVGFSNVNFTGSDLSETDFSGINLAESILRDSNLHGANLTGSTFIKAVLIKSNLNNADLTNANFKDANLYGSDLTDAILKDINLSNAILRNVDFTRADLTKVILKGVNLSNANLRETNLSGVDLAGANLNGVDLSGSDLTDANLSDVKIAGSKMNEIKMSGVNLSNVNLNGINLSGSDLSNANLNGVDLSNSDLTKVILKGVNLSNANLRETNLSGVDLAGANLNGVDLSNSDLTKVILNGVDLSNSDLKGANLSGSDLSGVDLNGVDLSNSDLTKVILNGVDLSNSDLKGANLSGSDLTGADLSGADLSDIMFTGAIMNRINLSESNLAGISLTRVDLSNSDLKGANLSKTDLRDSNISGSDLSGADLSGADLSGADLSGADLTNTELKGADLSGADLTNTELNKKDIETAKSDDKTKLPERGFFFFRELFSFLKSLFGL